LDVTLPTAIISGAVALIVALVSLVTAVVTNRTTNRTQAELMRMKNDFAATEPARGIVSTELGSSLDGLKQALQVTQRLKDEIQLILAALPSTLTADGALESIEAARVEMFAVYKDVHPHLREPEKQACHQAKNMAAYACTAVQAIALEGCEPATMPTQTREVLSRLRADLSDCQNLLRDSRTDRLVRVALGVSQPESSP